MHISPSERIFVKREVNTHMASIVCRCLTFVISYSIRVHWREVPQPKCPTERILSFLVIKIVLGWAAPVLSLYQHLVTVNAYCGISCSLIFSFYYVILILSATSGYPCVHPKHALSLSFPLFPFSLFSSSLSIPPP